MRVQTLDQEDPLEEEMATHSSILAWKISWPEKPGGLQSIRSQRIAHDWAHTCLQAWSQKLWTSFHCKVACMSSSLESGWLYIYLFGSVQFSHSVVSDSLQPHGMQHSRPPYPSPTPGVYPNSGPLSWWCHPAISSSVVPFSSCPQSFPASESFPISQLFAWGGQSTRVSITHY